ncbi:MAG: YesN/AraC family two-component response regulator [Alphaproteobacteria bacterium]|jgi:YesN/AraC family two-component response regulator
MSFGKDKELLADRFNFLIVDDHDFMLHLIHEALNAARAGKIDKAPNGRSAISALKKIRKIDFIITDFNMPKMNGMELLRAVRLGEANVDRETPVIMLSGFDDELLLMTAMEFDANGYIPKPVSRVDLVSRMNQIFMKETTYKSVDEYRLIEMPEIDGVFDQDNLSTLPTASVPNEVRNQGVATPLESVQVGSVVVEDVVTASGVTLIKEGSLATRQLIDFLIEVRGITQVELLVVAKI